MKKVLNVGMKKKDRLKLIMVSSSGGHYEQLRMLKSLQDSYDLFWITEKTDYSSPADYYLIQTGLKDMLFPARMMVNVFRSLFIWCKVKPQVVITTGTMVALPLLIIARMLRKKTIYIESFARVYNGTRAGKFMYKHVDLFIYQWETLNKVYPKGIYGGSIY